MKKTLISAISIVLLLATCLCSCSLFSREFRLQEEAPTLLDCFSITYGEEPNISYKLTIDKDGDIYYQEGDNIRYFMKNESGSYTSYRCNSYGRWFIESESLTRALVDMQLERFYLVSGSYYYYTRYGSYKKLDDVTYEGRDCYAYEVTEKDSAGRSYTITTVSEVFIDKETGLRMKDEVIEYNDPTGNTDELGSIFRCSSFNTSPEDVVAPAVDQ